MMKMVRKRNGAVVPFDKQRIVSAVNKAFEEVDGTVYENDTATSIAEDIYNSTDKVVNVEEIQDMVESMLMGSERKDVAKAYIRYRYKREVGRGTNSDFIKALSEKINASDVENANANMDERSFGGRIGAASDLMMKKYALHYCK